MKNVGTTKTMEAVKKNDKNPLFKSCVLYSKVYKKGSYVSVNLYYFAETLYLKMNH